MKNAKALAAKSEPRTLSDIPREAGELVSVDERQRFTLVVSWPRGETAMLRTRWLHIGNKPLVEAKFRDLGTAIYATDLIVEERVVTVRRRTEPV